MVSLVGSEPTVGSTVEVGEISSLAKGVVIVGDGNDAPTALPVGTNGQVLTADSAAASGVKWSSAGSGDMSTAAYDAANVNEQLAGLTATQTLTNKTIDTANNTITVAKADVSDLESISATPTASNIVKADGTGKIDAGWLPSALDAGTLDGIDSTGFALASHNHAASEINSGSMADARIPASNVTQHVAAIDHDSLLNFAANEHFTMAAITQIGTVTSGNVDAILPAATTTVSGIAELATNAEVQTGTDTGRIVTPAGLQSKVASTSAKGIIELATSAETITGTDTERAVTPAGLQAKVASTTAKGISELATTAEIDAGTDTERVMCPDEFAASVHGTKVLAVTVFEDGTDVETGDAKRHVVVPTSLNGMNLVRAQAVTVTAGTTGATTVMVHNKTSAADMLSGAISIASAGTVGTVGTIDTDEDDVSTDDVLRIDVDGVSTTAPKGLIVILEFRLP